MNPKKGNTMTLITETTPLSALSDYPEPSIEPIVGPILEVSLSASVSRDPNIQPAAGYMDFTMRFYVKTEKVEARFNQDGSDHDSLCGDEVIRNDTGLDPDDWMPALMREAWAIVTQKYNFSIYG